MDIFDYQFDGDVGDLIAEAEHYNVNQTSPVDGATTPGGYGWDCITGGKGQVNHELLTVCRFKEYPGTPNYSVTLAVTFPVFTYVDRYVDLWARMIDDENGYIARLESVFGSPTVSLVRVSGGSETVLDGPTAVSGMSAGVAVDLKIECIDDEIKVYVADAEKCSQTEAAADLIFGNYRVGLGTTYGRTPLGPTVDNLRVTDAASESGLTGGYILKVGEIAYGKDEMIAAGITLKRLTPAYLGPCSLTISVQEPHTDPLWHPELPVTLKAYISGAWEYVFQGRMRIVNRHGEVGGEGNEYFAVGPRGNAKYVNPTHPARRSAIIWNASEDDEDYDADFAGKEVGEMIAWYFDNHLDELRFHGAIAQTGTPYIQAELDAMSTIPTRMDIGGDFESVMLSLLSKAPNIAIKVDHSTLIWHFVDFTSSPTQSYAYDDTDDPVIPANIVDDDATGCYTAVLVRSARREKVQGFAKTSDGSLTRHWSPTLSRIWTPQKQFRSKIAVEVAELVDDGVLTDAPILRLSGKVLFPGEWLNTLWTFTSGGQDENAFKVIANIYDQITLEKAGGFPTDVPSPGDTAVIEDKRANSDADAQNGFSYVHRQYLVKDKSGAGLELAKDPCATLWQESENEEERVPHQMTYEATAGVIVIGMPIVIPREDKPGCENAEGYNAAEASLDYWYWEETVREYRTPATGWYGPAYSESATKWSGGGDPGPDDWGVRRVFLVEDSQWLTNEQSAAIQAAADMLVQVLSMKPYGGSLVLKGLVWELRDLDIQLHFTTGASVRGSTTSFETANIIPFEVNYDFLADRTLVTYGNSGDFARQWSDLKDRMTKSNELLALKMRMRKLEDFTECVQKNKQPKVAAQDNNPICATRVLGKFKGGGSRGGAGGSGGSGGEFDPAGLIDGVAAEFELVWDKIEAIQATQETQKEIEDVPPPVEPGGAGEDDDPTTATPPDRIQPIHITSDGTIYACRPGSTPTEEPVELEPDGTDPTRPKYGPDWGARIIGPIEIGQHYAPFHHQTRKDSEDGIWNGIATTMPLTYPVLSGTAQVFLRDGGAGQPQHQIEGPAADYQLSGTPPQSVVFATPPSTNSYAEAVYDHQGLRVRRSETMLVEHGIAVEATKTLQAESGIAIEAEETLLVEILAP